MYIKMILPNTWIVAKLYPGCVLAYINFIQTVAWWKPGVQFGYDLCMPNHTLGIVWLGGICLPVTPATPMEQISGNMTAPAELANLPN